MKDYLTNDIKDIFRQAVNWLHLEVDYIKLTAAEKLTILMSAVVLGAVFMLLAMIIVVLLSMALVGVLEIWMQTGVAFLCASGIILLLGLLIFILRKPLLINPISRFLTKLIMDKKEIES